jgi:DNA helicase HerA-like ATPase
MVKMESYIKALVDSGVFHSKKPPVKPGLNIVNISGLDVEIQRFIVDIWLGKVFKSCKIRGTYKDMLNKPRGDKCDTFVIIDESKLVAGNSREKNDPYSFLNRIATEARSFGLGLIVAAQSADHFPPEFLKNFYTQMILNTSVADFDTVRKSFGVDKTLLEFTQKGWGKALVKTGRVFNKVILTEK